jgi:hypothetical protein
MVGRSDPRRARFRACYRDRLPWREPARSVSTLWHPLRWRGGVASRLDFARTKTRFAFVVRSCSSACDGFTITGGAGSANLSLIGRGHQTLTFTGNLVYDPETQQAGEATVNRARLSHTASFKDRESGE